MSNTHFQKILFVDDEKPWETLMKGNLKDHGFDVLYEQQSENTLKRLKQNKDIQLVLLDVIFDNQKKNGIQILKEVKEKFPNLPVVMLTKDVENETYKKCTKLGSNFYFIKEDALKSPDMFEKLAVIIRNAIAFGALQLSDERESYGRLIGKSKPMQEIYRQIETYSNSDANVLISGESGTGKELVAKEIHHASTRKDGPFVAINCGALPETLLESELFGHEKGAFTGAVALRRGRFEMADKGTLFLDEVGEMPQSLQIKLLRVAEAMEFERVGGERVIGVDVRLISATNKDPEKEVEEERFRYDLYYRLNVLRIDMPPLRERKEDIPILAKKFSVIHGQKKEFERNTIELLQTYHWPGNVRELENAIQRAAAISKSSVFMPDDFNFLSKEKDRSNSAKGTDFVVQIFLERLVKREERLGIGETDRSGKKIAEQIPRMYHKELIVESCRHLLRAIPEKKKLNGKDLAAFLNTTEGALRTRMSGLKMTLRSIREECK